MKKTRLRQAYEQKDYSLMLDLLRKQEPEQAREIELCFELDKNQKTIVRNKQPNLDDGFVFLKEPFTGNFHFYLDREDIMPIGIRRVYPFAYVEWLMDNALNYTKPLVEQEINNHVFAYPLGDYSPEILLYRQDSDEIVVPLFRYKPIVVDHQEFSREVGRVSKQALEILEKNKKFRKSKKFKDLKKKLSDLL